MCLAFDARSPGVALHPPQRDQWSPSPVHTTVVLSVSLPPSGGGGQRLGAGPGKGTTGVERRAVQGRRWGGRGKGNGLLCPAPLRSPCIVQEAHCAFGPTERTGRAPLTNLKTLPNRCMRKVHGGISVEFQTPTTEASGGGGAGGHLERGCACFSSPLNSEHVGFTSVIEGKFLKILENALFGHKTAGSASAYNPLQRA